MTEDQNQVAPGTPEVEEEEEIKVHAQTWIVVFCINLLYCCQLLAVVGSGFLTQSITKFFGDSSQGVWFSQVLTILTVALSPPVSQAVDYWGRKWIVVVLSSMGCFGCIIASRAQSTGTVIAGFTITGLSLGCQCVLMAIVSEILPRKQRPLAQATINATAGLGGVLGVVIGGLLVRHGDLGHFRIYFYVTAACYAVATIGTALCYHPPPREKLSMTNAEKLRSMDWIGISLCGIGLVLFSIALSWSRNPYPWTDAHILAPFILGCVMLIGLGIYEWKIKKDGMLHHDLFRDRNFAIVILCIFADGLIFFTVNSYYAFQVSVFTGADLLISGLQFAMLFFIASPMSFIAGAYSARAKDVRNPIVLGFICFVIFNILLATTTPSSPHGVFWGFPVFIGLGLGLCLPAMMVTAQLSTPPDLIALATGLMVGVRSVGGTIALAINNAIFNSALSTEMPKKIAAATLPLGLPASSLGQLIPALANGDNAALAQVPGATPEILGAAGEALVEAYHIAFRNCWIAAACFCAVAVVGGCFVNVPASEFNAHIDAPAESEVVELQKAIESKHGYIEEVEVARKNEGLISEKN
ncbi:hypothetical protein ONS95_006829 [Cadophora gregata]|uniref:uncharacterized protein n=1 Tax=Cadophora gregata TaxID=51156 RepID=UPI0026DC9F3D|nr:uncharacterized protein ONS95_006829 [Cadophora gregata]KAK0101671.1 hypothetical protein ONS95_006829 [Cadophora gregata]KAK0106312.1 hypothetical protein ONS96_003950 [Cadophora gregata f. sp. sojae]